VLVVVLSGLTILVMLMAIVVSSSSFRVVTRVVNIAAMNDEIVIGNEIFCSSDYRAIGFKMSIDR
jgi:hypothetical protein